MRAASAQFILHLEHAAELLEVGGGGATLDAEQLPGGLRAERGVGVLFEFEHRGRGRLEVVPHEEGAVVADLPMHKLPGQAEADRRIAGEAELFDAEEDVLQLVAARDPVEPAAHREVGDRHLGLAQGLHRLGGDLDVSSGRQTVTSEQRGHLGEFSRGGGMAATAAARARATFSVTQASSSGVIARRTRCLVAR